MQCAWMVPRYSAAPAEPGERAPSRGRTAAALAALLLAGLGLAAVSLLRPNATLARLGDAVGENLEGACGLVEDSIEYHTHRQRRLPLENEMPSAEMCCAACEADPNCGAWTWGKKKGVVGLTHMCFLKELAEGEVPRKIKRPEVISGMPSAKFNKHGVIAKLKAEKNGKRPEAPGVRLNETCAGDLWVGGSRGRNYTVAVIPGGKAVEFMEHAWIVPYMGGSGYLVDYCDADYTGWNNQHASMKLLGKSLRYTVNLAGAGCGCHVMLYLASKYQNHKDFKDSEYRVDIMGANQYAWTTQLHTKGDFYGKSSGYGGGGETWPGNRDWEGTQYSPGSSCIDTSKPFDVLVMFPTDFRGDLKYLEVKITQFNSPCSVKARINDYIFNDRNGLKEITKELAKGMTLVFNYTSHEDMLWMDGTGVDGKGPCVNDAPMACPSTTRLYGFTVSDLADPNPELVQRKNNSNPLADAPMSGLETDLTVQGVRHIMTGALQRAPPARPAAASGASDTAVGGPGSARDEGHKAYDLIVVPEVDSKSRKLRGDA